MNEQEIQQSLSREIGRDIAIKHAVKYEPPFELYAVSADDGEIFVISREQGTGAIAVHRGRHPDDVFLGIIWKIETKFQEREKYLQSILAPTQGTHQERDETKG